MPENPFLKRIAGFLKQTRLSNAGTEVGFPASSPEQARLPQSMLEHQIGDMTIGETGFTVPWALVVCPEGKCWLNASYPIQNFTKPEGSSTMKVGKSHDGYIVAVPQGFKESPRVISPREHMIPVRKLYEIPQNKTKL